MHPHTLGTHIGDRQLTTNFELKYILCADMFHMRIPKPCLPICPYPEKRNHPGFVNISPTLVNDTSMERSSQVASYYTIETQKFDFFFFKVRNLNFDL